MIIYTERKEEKGICTMLVVRNCWTEPITSWSAGRAVADGVSVDDNSGHDRCRDFEDNNCLPHL